MRVLPRPRPAALLLLLLALLTTTGTFARVINTAVPILEPVVPTDAETVNPAVDVETAVASLRTRAAPGPLKDRVAPGAFPAQGLKLQPPTSTDSSVAFVRPSSDAKPQQGGGVAAATSAEAKPMAVDNWSGLPYTDSRFDLTYTVAAKRAGRLRVKYLGVWYMCTAAVI